jgi:hypothetical protein
MLVPLLLALTVAGPTSTDLRASGAGGGAEVVEEVVAVVRNPLGSPPRVITLTRLVEEARIVLASRGAVEAAVRPIDSQLLRATLEWVLDQTLLSDEAGRLRVAEVTRDQVAAELVRFRARFPGAAAYARFLSSAELTDEEVSSVLARMLRVDRYLETRVGRGGTVADEDVQQYARERGLSVESRAARDAVRARMSEARVDSAVRDLVSELRGRADIRFLDPELAGAAAKPEERR